MSKRDLMKELSVLYRPSAKQVEEVVVPRMNFLMIDGEGDPNASETYAAAVEALFSMSYTLKFAIKKSPAGIDYKVMPLEALWWADDMAAFTQGKRSEWKWTALIMQPDVVTPQIVDESRDALAKKKDLPALELMRFEPFEEGLCAQIMHVGPFSEEGPNIMRVHAYIEESGRHLTGKHHEIYLSDIRRADSSKWKTVVRQPMS